VAAARLYVIDQIHGAQVEWISSQAVKSVRGHAHNLPLLDAVSHIGNQTRVRRIRIDF
jgi:hypothetical protein